MKAQDLIIGRYYLNDGDETKMEADVLSYILHVGGEFEWSPIPLTEEWLLMFGFEEKPKRALKKYWRDFGDMAILIDEDFDFYIHQESYEGETLRKTEYVHQLQNLYHALTGEELTIKQHEKANH